MEFYKIIRSVLSEKMLENSEISLVIKHLYFSQTNL